MLIEMMLFEVMLIELLITIDYIIKYAINSTLKTYLSLIGV